MLNSEQLDSEVSSPEHWLLVTDVDDTLVGDDEALLRFISIVNELPHVLIALNSSRPIASVRKTLSQIGASFTPDAIVGAMGTEIEIGGQHDESWRARFAGFHREPIDEVMAAFDFPAHDAEFQTPFKASYAVPFEAPTSEAAEFAVREVMPQSRIVRSGLSDFDVIPSAADKGEAAVHVARLLKVLPEHVIVAGDSGNDLAMFQCVERGIVVGNARHELKQALDPARVFFAKGKRADGLLEGLMHYGAVPADSPQAHAISATISTT